MMAETTKKAAVCGWQRGIDEKTEKVDCLKYSNKYPVGHCGPGCKGYTKKKIK